MKTYKSQIFLFAVLTIAALATGCGKKSKDNNNNLYNQGRYISQNGSCIDRQTGQQVQPQLCTNTAGYGQYTWNGSQCVNTQNNQPVDPTYCQNTGGQYPPGGQYPTYGSQCYGWHYYIDQTYGQAVSVYCNGYDCAQYQQMYGIQLLSYETGYPVSCM